MPGHRRRRIAGLSIRGLMWLYAFLSFQAMVSAGMNLPLHGASERSSKNLPSEWFLPIMADFTIIPFFPPPNNAPYCGRSPFTCFPSLRARQKTEHQRRIWYLTTAAHKPVNASRRKAGNRQQEAGGRKPEANSLPASDYLTSDCLNTFPLCLLSLIIGI